MSEHEIEAVVVCKNVDCVVRGSNETTQYLKDKLAELGINIPVGRYDCFSLCDFGPNVLVYPEGTMYCLEQPEKTTTPAIEKLDAVVNHVRGGEKAEELTKKAKPFQAAVDLVIELIDSGLGSSEGIPPRKK